MPGPNKGIVEQITGTIGSILSTGNEKVDKPLKRTMCGMLCIGVFLIILMWFIGVVTGSADGLGLDALWNWLMSMIGGGEAVSDVPTS